MPRANTNPIKNFIMFKKLADRLRPSNPQYLSKIRVEYGEILKQTDCEGLMFFIQPNLVWEGGLNRHVLLQAGNELLTYVQANVTRPTTGEVFALPGFNLPFKKVFMAILPPWDGGNGFEERDFLNCYRGVLSEAEACGIRSIAIPAMGQDKRDFPHIRFARMTIKGVLDGLDPRIDFVKITCIDRTMMATYQAQLAKMKGKVRA